MKKFLSLIVATIFLILATNTRAQDSLNVQKQDSLKSMLPAKNTLNIWPNPADGPFSMYMGSTEKTFSITIYSIVGKIVYEMEDLPTNLEVNFESIEEGLYFYSATCNEKSYRGKIIIHK